MKKCFWVSSLSPHPALSQRERVLRTNSWHTKAKGNVKFTRSPFTFLFPRVLCRFGFPVDGHVVIEQSFQPFKIYRLDQVVVTACGHSGVEMFVVAGDHYERDIVDFEIIAQTADDI